jgi:hypothetical protein
VDLKRACEKGLKRGVITSQWLLLSHPFLEQAGPGTSLLLKSFWFYLCAVESQALESLFEYLESLVSEKKKKKNSSLMC